MKMLMVVVPANSAELVLDALVNTGYTATYAETRGGMLRQSQFSLFIAVKKEQLDEVLDIIKANCHTQVEMTTHPVKDRSFTEMPPLKAELGGAIAFIWDIDRIETF